MPMNESVMSESTAKPTVPTNPAAMIAVRFGRISAVMMRQVRSPFARAASTKSRRRNDRVWALNTRAPQAQPVIAITSATVTPPTVGSWPAMMMMSGSCGMTRNTFASTERLSSRSPPTYPAVTPMMTPMAVAMMPATKPTTMTPRVPTRSCENTS